MPAAAPEDSAPRSRLRRGRAWGESRGMAATPMHALRRSSAALAVIAALAAGVGACGGEPPAGPNGAAGESDAPERAAASDRPVVEVPSQRAPAFLDPDAEPRTDLGRLRARHLPVWTPDFDWAFPPEACGTAWELDGIAEPAEGGTLAILGDLAAAAALSVMRYEHQFSRALAEPDALGQLCVATASVGPALRSALDVLASYLDSGAQRREAAAFPEAVRVLGASPTRALAVACLQPGYSEAVSADGAVAEAPRARARLQAYLLTLSQGLEDRVADLSYRVWEASHRPADDCSGLDGWTAEWQAHMQAWIDEGRLWSPLAAEVTVGGLCDSPPPDGPDECPRDWPS